MSNLKYYNSPHGTRIAYHKTEGSKPGVMFLGGFMSDMDGGKALALEAHCKKVGRAFIRFDYQGHGKSSGDFENGTIGLWTMDALAVLDHLTEGPQLLVGSSMGGWTALLCAKARPGRVKCLVGIAAAPDFTTRMWNEELSEAQRQTILREGLVKVPTEYGPEPYILTQALFDDGYQNRVLNAPLHLDIPIRLIQGMSDKDVPWQTALNITRALTSSDVDIILVPDGDHRLSEPQDLARLTRVVDELVSLVG